MQLKESCPNCTTDLTKHCKGATESKACTWITCYDCKISLDVSKGRGIQLEKNKTWFWVFGSNAVWSRYPVLPQV